MKIKEKEYKASLEGKIKKVPNFQFLSDCYRKQINKTFVNYNPNIHLSNIHKLRETKPETEKEYQSRNKLHIEQWCVRSGLNTWQSRQYLFFLKSSSPI